MVESALESLSRVDCGWRSSRDGPPVFAADTTERVTVSAVEITSRSGTDPDSNSPYCLYQLVPNTLK
jgi:hypothetical protein